MKRKKPLWNWRCGAPTKEQRKRYTFEPLSDYRAREKEKARKAKTRRKLWVVTIVVEDAPQGSESFLTRKEVCTQLDLAEAGVTFLSTHAIEVK